MRRWIPMTLAALLAVCGSAAARNKGAIFIDDEDRPEPIGMRSAEEEVAIVVKKIESGQLPKIEFEFDSEEILLQSRPTLDAVVALMLDNPKLKLMVRAHTCLIGSEAYNLDLSQRRAKSVKAYLVKSGVPPPSVRYRGYGFSQPIADNSTEEGRSKNRRVEFRFTFRDWPSVY